MCSSEFNLQGTNMQPNFTLSNGSYKVWQFHSGEVQVQVNLSSTYCQQITGSILCSDHLMELLQLVEAIRYADRDCNIELLMPYCAYSRQDRRCNPGESFSLKIFTDLINSCNFSKVTTYDNHSDVSTALINNCANKHVADMLYFGKELIDFANYNFLISPDAGANKKVFDCSKRFNLPMIRADKQRDTTTGAITHTEVFATAEQLDGATVLIVDDICAGGRTFAELAKAVKLIQPNCTINLFVTHGFFSNGFNAMKEAGISKFITTNSVPQVHTCNQLTVIQL